MPSPNGPNGDRDDRGRFANGNSGGPGNPFARRVAALRSLLLEEVGDDGLAEVARSMVVKAKGGDVAAAKLLFSYTVGKPSTTVDPDRLDIDESDLESELSSGFSILF